MKARTVIPILAMPAAPAPSTGRLATVGRWLRDHATLLRRLQWAVVLVYAALLVIPALLPLPDQPGTLDQGRRSVVWTVASGTEQQWLGADADERFLQALQQSFARLDAVLAAKALGMSIVHN